MILCPKCGFPQEEPRVVSDSDDVSCDLCHWSGLRRELLRAAGSGLDDHPHIVKKFRALMEVLHHHMAPKLARNIVLLGLIPAEEEYAPLLAEVVRDATRAMCESVITGLFPTEEEDQDAGESTAG